MFKTGKRWVRAAVVCGVLAGGVLVPATAAQAASCTYQYSPSLNPQSLAAVCTGVTRFRVYVYCIGENSPRYGQWQGSGGRSSASCYPKYVETGGVQLV